MTLEDFVLRHNEWNEDMDKEFLLAEILACLEEVKKALVINVKGKVIYAEVEPEHFVEDLLARFLSLQFQDYMIVLESARGTFAAGNNTAGVVKTQIKMGEIVSKLNKI